MHFAKFEKLTQIQIFVWFAAEQVFHCEICQKCLSSKNLTIALQ